MYVGRAEHCMNGIKVMGVCKLQGVCPNLPYTELNITCKVKVTPSSSAHLVPFSVDFCCFHSFALGYDWINKRAMLTHRGFSAWIVVDGEPLPEYLVSVDEARHEVSCWIPGEPGKVRDP